MNVTQILENSKTISLILPTEATTDNTQTALLLACGFKKLGKQVSIENTRETSETPASQEKIFVVSLKGLAPWIAKVRYEKEAKDLKLYFTLNKGEIPPEALSFQIQNQTDLTIIVGDETRLNNSHSLPSINVLSDSQVKSPLLELLCGQKDPAARLLGTILSKLEYMPQQNTYAIILHGQDFQGMPGEQKHIFALGPELAENFGENSSYLFLLNSPHGTQGILWSHSPQLQAKFRDIAGGQQKGPWVLLRPAPLSSEQLKHAFLS